MLQGPILANTKRSFTCQMKVPDIIAYNLEACNIIDLGYFLKVNINSYLNWYFQKSCINYYFKTF